jgi:citrate synthase
MSVLSKLASAQDRKDEEPNKDLGRELVAKRDIEAIREVAENLWNKDRRVQTDCLSVLEQIGLSAPELIEDYASEFLQMIFSKDNRVVWAAMINLALVADRKSQEIFEQFDEIVKVIEKGSVITKDNGIKTLAKTASTNSEYREVIMPYLMEQLRSCRPKSVPQYAESIRVAVTSDNQEEYLRIIKERYDMLSTAQQRRVQKLLKTF